MVIPSRTVYRYSSDTLRDAAAVVGDFRAFGYRIWEPFHTPFKTARIAFESMKICRVVLLRYEHDAICRCLADIAAAEESRR